MANDVIDKSSWVSFVGVFYDLNRTALQQKLARAEIERAKICALEYTRTGGTRVGIVVAGRRCGGGGARCNPNVAEVNRGLCVCQVGGSEA